MAQPKILLATADESLRERVAAAGSVTVARSLAEAVEVAAASRFDVIVCDARLPGGCGALAQQRGLPPAALIVAGGLADEPTAAGLGAVAMLSPLPAAGEMEELVEALVASPQRRALVEGALEQARRGALEDALVTLERASQAAQGGVLGAWARHHAARCHWALGHAQRALEEFDALVEDRPTFWRAALWVALAHDAAGDARTAGAWAARAQAAGAPPTRLADLRPLLKAPVAKADEDDMSGAFTLVERSGDAPAPAPPPAARPVPPPSVAAAPAVEPPRQPQPVPAAKPGARPSRILLADDSELALEMVGEVLRNAGFDVTVARDGKQAIELARASRPDLMLLDGLMPGATGFDVCKEVKEVLYPHDPPPVFILSAIYTKQRQKWEAKSIYKVDEVLPKPVSDEELLAAIRKRLG